MNDESQEREIMAIERPNRRLMYYNLLACLALGPFFFLALIPWTIRYRTLRYRISDEGISMRWGALFRREVILNYNRIQDIHLRSNVVERWFGLARIQIQTASGNAGAEMTLEGLLQFEGVRNFLYTRMRGITTSSGTEGRAPDSTVSAEASTDELAQTLSEVGMELRSIRELIHRRLPPDLPGDD
jgi:putative membrane protein